MKKWLPVLLILTLAFINVDAQQFTDPIKTYGKYVTVGTAWGDYDNDGYVDLYLSNGLDNYFWVNFLFRNLGNGTMDSSMAAGPLKTDRFTSGGAAWGDYNNDGYLDMLVANPNTKQTGSGFGKTYYAETKLYINNQNGTFSDVASLGDLGAETSGSGLSSWDSPIADVWADTDNDGWLDVLQSNATIGGNARNFTAYTNNQDGTFTLLSNNITSQGTSSRAGMAWADFDEDGDMDVVTLSGAIAQHTVLWVFNGTNFDSTHILVGGGANGPNTQTGTWLDYDNDGDLDFYVGTGANDSNGPEINHLFRNDTGILVEVTSATVGTWLDDLDFSLASTAADFDNDGDIDIFEGTDNQGSYHNHLYENNGDGTFTENLSTTLSDSGFARSGAFADMDNDGDMDLMLGREGPNFLYKNNGSSNGWMEILCKGDGTSVNNSAIGALVKVNATIGGINYTQIRDVSAETGRGSHNMLRTHFGMGNATSAANITVRWPGPGTTTSYTDMPLDKIMVYKYAALTGTASVIPAQNFMYLIGSTGAAVDFTSNTATSAGTLTITRTNSDPGSVGYSGTATAPDASTITPNSVATEHYWTISQTGLTGNFTCEVYLDLNGLTGITNPDKLVILKRANSSTAWTPLNALRIGNTLYSNASVSSFSEFAIGYNSADQSLPVELVSFNAARLESGIQLQWQTASELENVGFILERSLSEDDGFTEIASYRSDDALRGQGNSSRSHNYNYIDHAVVPGTEYFYRLSDISIDGMRAYHGVVKATDINIISNFVLWPTYPNPFNPSTHIRIEMPGSGNRVVINVYNALGELIRTIHNGTLSAGIHNFSWNGKNSRGAAQASGVYILRAQNGVQIQTQKMLLVR